MRRVLTQEVLTLEDLELELRSKIISHDLIGVNPILMRLIPHSRNEDNNEFVEHCLNLTFPGHLWDCVCVPHGLRPLGRFGPQADFGMRVCPFSFIKEEINV